MKKLSILALAFMAAFALASCNRQEIDPPQGGVQGKYLLTEITASTGDEDTKTDILSNNSVVNWNENDQIVVKGTDGALHYYKLKHGSGTPVGQFFPAPGQTPASYNSLTDLTAIYPACAAELSGGELYVNINNLDLSGSYLEKGLTSWTADSPFSFSNNDIKVAVPSGTTLGGNGKLNFKFKQLGTCCFFTFDFTQAEQAPSFALESVERIQITTLEGVALGGRAKVMGTSLGTITNPLTTIDWTVTRTRPMSEKIEPYFVFYPEVNTNTTLKITLTTTDHEFVFTGKPTRDFEAGKRMTFPVIVDKNFTQGGSRLAYTSSPRTDVDQFYYYGGTNCLLLPSTHQVGYLDVTQYVTDSHWHNTKNAADVLTHKPAVYAKIIWSEGANVIASDMVDASNGYKLKLPGSDDGAADAISTDSNGKSTLTIKRGTASGGNALVGIYDSSDKLLWSYHIWCPEDNPLEDALYDFTITNSGTYTVMTMPIGSLKKADPNMADPQNAMGLYYQWGRKDPMGRATHRNDASGGQVLEVKGPDQSTALSIGDPDYAITGGNLKHCVIWLAKSGGSENENKLHNAWNALSSPKPKLSRFMLDYTVSKPWMFVACQDVYDSSWIPNDNWLWGNGNGEAYPTMEDTYKSIFDPSPEGFRIAPVDIFLCLTKSHDFADASGYSGDDLEAFKAENFNVVSNVFDNGNNTQGYSFYFQNWKSGPSVHFLTTGQRMRNGSMADVLTDANYSVSGALTKAGRRCYFRVDYVSPVSGSDRSRAFQTICVKEY